MLDAITYGQDCTFPDGSFLDVHLANISVLEFVP